MGTSCSCDKDKIEDAKRRAVRRIAPYMCDEDGTRLFYVDSFGFRGPFPGECKACYDRVVKGMQEESEGMYD